MIRSGKKLFSTVLASVVAASLAACGGGGSHSASLPQTAPTSAAAAAPYSGPLADATFKITIPGPKNSAFKRRPAYVSSGTKSVKFVINSASGLTAGQITSYNAVSSFNHFDTGTLPNANCPASGADFICTVTMKVPPGTDNLTISAYDNTGGSGNILSQQVATFTVVAATTNSFNIVLDANLTTPNGSLIVNGSGACQNGPVGASYGAVGTSAVTFNVAYTDAAGKTVPTGVVGQPKLQIQDSTATYQSAGGTINATGGTVTFSINQAAQTYTLTPSTVPISNAAVNVRAIAPNSTGSSDGLTYTVASSTKSYTFAAGTAPPSHNFLAAVEHQQGTTSGQVDFFNLTLGSAGGADLFNNPTAFSPATLAGTNSTNENKPDVDNPQVLAWDTNGDLLVGNGDDGGANHGNMACVPVGAIATGANSSTTVSQNVTSPTAIAYDPRDGSVALADNPATASFQLSEYLLTGNYTAASGGRNFHETGTNVGAHGVTSMVPLAGVFPGTGTYAVTVTNGCEQDATHANCGGTTPVNEVAIVDSSGTVTRVTDTSTFSIDDPYGIGWDAQNSQLVVANNVVWHSSLAFYTITAGPTAVKTKVIQPGGIFGSQPDLVAVSPDGHVAVKYTPGLFNPAIQVYDNTAARNPVFGPIPYNSTSDNNCSVYIYGNDNGGSAHVNDMKWLSNTKLLVALQVVPSGGPNAQNGIYIYDISTSAVPAGHSDADPNCGAGPSALPAAPKQTGFQHITNLPLGAAYKP
jgi:hypothetical protein